LQDQHLKVLLLLAYMVMYKLALKIQLNKALHQPIQKNGLSKQNLNNGNKKIINWNNL